MAPEDLARVDAAVEEFKRRLLAVGFLKRTSKAQRTALAAAHSVVLSLPAVLRGPQPEGSMLRHAREKAGA